MDRETTVRILILDGGGTKGYLQTKALKRILAIGDMPENDLWRYFDVIAGTSVGGIAALGYGLGKTPTQLLSFFTDSAKMIFTIRTAGDVATSSHNASEPSNRPNFAQKAAILGSGDAIYNSAYSDSNYGSVFLKQTLQSIYLDNTMSDMKTNVLVPAFNIAAPHQTWFSNVNKTGYTGQNALAVDVGMSTSAAQTYFLPYTFNNNTYQDGGTFSNNPVNRALALAQSLKRNATRFIILSVGTGITPIAQIGGSNALEQVYSNIQNFIDSTLSGQTESAAENIEVLSTQTLSGVISYRFQASLLDSQNDVDIDNTTTTFFNYLDSKVNAQITADTQKIEKFWDKFWL